MGMVDIKKKLRVVGTAVATIFPWKTAPDHVVMKSAWYHGSFMPDLHHPWMLPAG
jgi:hypothetical protein